MDKKKKKTVQIPAKTLANDPKTGADATKTPAHAPANATRRVLPPPAASAAGKGLKRKMVERGDNISIEFVCPGCKKYFVGAIFMCKSGHNICSNCRTPEVEACPVNKECQGYMQYRI
jgi:hypothetical protein